MFSSGQRKGWAKQDLVFLIIAYIWIAILIKFLILFSDVVR